MTKKHKIFIVPPDWRALAVSVVAFCVLVILEIKIGDWGTPRWAHTFGAIAFFMPIVIIRHACFFTFQKGRIVTRVCGIPLISHYYHECSSCTIVRGFSESLLARKKTVLFLTFSPNPPFDVEKDQIMRYAASLGKKRFYDYFHPKYVWIPIPEKLVPCCIAEIKEYYPDIRTGEDHSESELK